MHKKIIAGISCLMAGLVLVWCGTQVERKLPLDVSLENMNCVQAVKDYLDQSDARWRWAAVRQWDAVVVDYIGRLEDGSVFDTSVESVAQACGVYNQQRDYQSGLPFTVWAGQMIQWFDAWVMGMRVGQTKTVHIPADQAYGAWDEAYLMPVPKSSFDGAENLKPWDQVMTSMGQSFKVHQVEQENIILDANPPLAGKDLIFDITLKSVN